MERNQNFEDYQGQHNRDAESSERETTFDDVISKLYGNPRTIKEVSPSGVKSPDDTVKHPRSEAPIIKRGPDFEPPAKRDPYFHPIGRDPYLLPVKNFPSPTIRDPYLDPFKKDPFLDPIRKDPFLDPIRKDPFLDPDKKNPILDPIRIIDKYNRDPAFGPNVPTWENPNKVPPAEPPVKEDPDLEILKDRLNRIFGIKPESDDGFRIVEKVEKGRKLEAATIEKYADTIANTLMRNEDFSYGPKKEKLNKMFEEAGLSGKETFEKLLTAINKKLEASGLKLEGNFREDSKIEKTLEKPKPSIYDVYYPPLIVTKKTDFMCLDLKLTSKNGEEDRMSVYKDTMVRSKAVIQKGRIPSDVDPFTPRRNFLE